MRSIYLARAALAATVAILFACVAEEPPGEETISLSDTVRVDASPYWNNEPALSMEDLEAGRHDTTWLRAAARDTTRIRLAGIDTLESEPLTDELPVTSDTTTASTAAPDTAVASSGRSPRVVVTSRFPETYDDLDRVGEAGADSTPVVHLPIAGDAQGPSVLYVQTLLDRSPFSPGVLDGKWGKNTRKAVYWLQRAEGLEATGEVDSLTFAHLVEIARRTSGTPDRFVRTVGLTEADVEGPFLEIPTDVHAQAELECMCYESALERVAERHHVAPELLERLNPGRALDSLAVGDSLRVPALAEREPVRDVARIVISVEGFYLHALDREGGLLYHFPITVGSRYQPSPTGDFEIASITFDPWFHWQPALFDEVPDTEPDARIPPGPNSPVGVVWMALTKDNYGIHGTSAPATIGYSTSHGCVRLTNWDARFLAERVEAGVPVEFRDVGEEPVATR